MIVTTTSRPSPSMVARAEQIAARCGVAYRPREEVVGDELRYVVARDREELRGLGTRLSVNPGLLHARRQSGRDHPLLVALCAAGPRNPVAGRVLGSAEAAVDRSSSVSTGSDIPLRPLPHSEDQPPLCANGPRNRIVDATLGMAADALHISDVLGCEVLGIEGSPAMYSLLEEGLPRVARTEPAAKRIRLHFGEAAEVLSTLPDASVDAVYLSPMFLRPRRAAPGFELLRAVALHAPMGERLLEEAARVARGPVVVKIARDDVLQVGREVGRVRGRAVDYVRVAPIG